MELARTGRGRRRRWRVERLGLLDDPGIQFVLAGDGPSAEEIRRLYAEALEVAPAEGPLGELIRAQSDTLAQP